MAASGENMVKNLRKAILALVHIIVAQLHRAALSANR
jgi:hypothetical protein